MHGKQRAGELRGSSRTRSCKPRLQPRLQSTGALAGATCRRSPDNEAHGTVPSGTIVFFRTRETVRGVGTPLSKLRSRVHRGGSVSSFAGANRPCGRASPVRSVRSARGRSAVKISHSRDTGMPPKCKFQEGEKVLCFHGPLIYEAKCLKSSITKEKQIKYFIHYAGWNKNWDEWVPESRVLKYNEANVQRQREVQRAHSNQQSAQKNKKGSTASKTQGRRSEGGREKDTDSRASTPVATVDKSISRFSKSTSSTVTPSSSHDSVSEAPRKKRSRLEPSGETEEYLSKVEVKIKIPEELKFVLIDESEVILKHHKLPALPVKNTVDKILDDYVESKSSGKSNDSTRESTLEITKGIREYFNITLGLQLLYKWERPQFIQIMNDNPETLPSQLYGAFHLLRLFVRLGGMLSYTTLDERSIQLLLSHFHDFLQYLQKNNAELFNLQQDYTDSPPDYHRKYG